MTKNDASFASVVSSIKNRVAVKDYYFDKLPQDIRSLAFTVSNLETLRQVEMVQQSLQNAIDNGESFKQWQANLDMDAVRNLSQARLETVYRTNVHNVYNQSTRFNAYTSNVTPYLMYDAVGDSRTRPEHMQLDGTVKRADSNFWNKYTPPLGYNCRCGIIPMDKEDADEVGISRKSTNAFPEPEFGNSRMGDVTTQVSKATEQAIADMDKSPLKQKFKEAQSNIQSLVDIWWTKNKTIFEE